MQGNPGDSVLCKDAPWHEPDNICTIRYYGPKVDEIVTIESLIRDERGMVYYKLKEYPTDPTDPSRDAGFVFYWFERTVSDKQLYQDLNIYSNDTRIS